MSGITVILWWILRLTGMYVCSRKAEKLNRRKNLWGFLGFISPILFMIWIQFLKPVVKWEEADN